MLKFKYGFLTRWIILSLILGSFFGLLINNSSLPTDHIFVRCLQWGGQAFIKLLKFLVVPVVLFSLIDGMGSFQDLKSFGRIFAKIMALFMVTTILAISMALSLGLLIQPGVNIQTEAPAASFNFNSAPSLYQTLLGFIPDNFFTALTEGNMIAIIFSALLLGIAATQAGEHGSRFLHWTKDMNAVLMKLVMIVMAFSPVGVFCLMTTVVATQGFSAFQLMAKYILCVFAALALHLFIVYGSLLKFVGKLSMRQFLRKYKEVMVFAFSTSSSNATIAVNLKTVEEKLGVHPKVASFTIPFGATVNMDGTAIMQGITTTFIAQMSGVDLSLTQILMVVFMTTMASIGTAGVPSVGLVTLTMVLTSVGLPIEGIGIVLAVDRLLDMSRTVVNVTGDAVCTVLVAQSEKMLKREVFDSQGA